VTRRRLTRSYGPARGTLAQKNEKNSEKYFLKKFASFCGPIAFCRESGSHEAQQMRATRISIINFSLIGDRTGDEQ